MSNYSLLYIIENEDFSAATVASDFNGIDVTTPEFAAAMEERELKAQTLQEAQVEGMDYAVLEVIANSQLDSDQSQYLIGVIRGNPNMTMDELNERIDDLNQHTEALRNINISNGAELDSEDVELGRGVKEGNYSHDDAADAGTMRDIGRYGVSAAENTGVEKFAEEIEEDEPDYVLTVDTDEADKSEDYDDGFEM